MGSKRVVSQMFHNSIGGQDSQEVQVAYKYNPPKIFLREDYLKKNGTCALYLQVIIGRKKKVIPLNLDVRPQDFDGLHIKKNISGASENNLIIDNCLARVNAIYTDFRLSSDELTIEKLIYNYHNFDLRLNFIAFMETAIKKRASDLAKNTHRQHVFLLDKLKTFRPEINFSDITTDFLKDFNSFMKKKSSKINKNGKRIEREGNGDNTRRKSFENLKTYIHLAINSGIRIKDPFKNFVLPPATDRIVFLTPDELQKLMNHYHSDNVKENHKRVLAGWLYMAFTSLRIGDAVRVNDSMVYGDTLVFVPEKTKRNGRTVSIHMTDQAKMFMNGIQGKLIKYYSGWQANKYIKEVAEIVGIKKNITNHVARHTFATIFLLKGGNVVTLKEILGHADMKHTMKYVHITSQFKKDQMVSAFESFQSPIK